VVVQAVQVLATQVLSALILFSQVLHPQAVDAAVLNQRSAAMAVLVVVHLA
jgi:hypothetical protein